MPDYKAMYYHLAGRMAASMDVLDMTVQALTGTTVALAELTEKLKQSQLVTEEMFLDSDESLEG